MCLLVAALRNTLDLLAISAHQKASISKAINCSSSEGGGCSAVPLAFTSIVSNSSAVTTLASDKAAAAADVNTTHGDDDLMDDDVDADVDDDDDDDDRYHPPKSKIQYDSDEDSFEDY